MQKSIDLLKNRPSAYAGKEIFEIHPVILGGSPTDPANKAALNRQEHIQTVRYWNWVIQDARAQRSKEDKQ
jgi:hypothetical protein